MAKPLLEAKNPKSVIVNTGTLLRTQGEEGIAVVYKLALKMGIETSGVHPGVALSCTGTHPPSPFEQHSFYVHDSSWGGFIEPYPTLSPTLKTMLAVSDELVVIGGGKHAADELEAFYRHGKKVSYFPAEMNHQSVQAWNQVASEKVEDLRGAAFHRWHMLCMDGQKPRL
ncbi:MAG: hypothetical protein R3F02_01290 [Thiolinea sp.]